MIKYLIILSLFITPIVNAGGAKGNGGDILVCKNNPKFKKPIALDLYQTIYINKMKVALPSSSELNELQLAHELIKRFKPYSPRRYQLYKKQITSFYNDTQFVSFPLGDINDSGKIKIPTNCELVQAVNQNPKLLTSGKLYLINKPSWRSIDVLSRASLIIHEIIYREINTETSEALRNFVSQILADTVKNFEFNEYLNYIYNIGFKFNSIGRIEASLDLPIEFHPNKYLKSAVARDKSILYYNNSKIMLKPIRTHFHDNGVPAEFCHYDSLTLNTPSGSVNAYCPFQQAKAFTTQFYKNGVPKQSLAYDSVLETETYKIFLGQTKEEHKFYGELFFYPSGKLKATDHSYGFLKLQDQIIRLAPTNIFFYDNGDVQLAHLAEIFQYNSGAGMISLKGKTTFYYGKLVESSISISNFVYQLRTQKLFLAGNAPVDFHSNGVLANAYLSKDQYLSNQHGNKKLYPAYSKLSLTINGEIF